MACGMGGIVSLRTFSKSKARDNDSRAGLERDSISVQGATTCRYVFRGTQKSRSLSHGFVLLFRDKHQQARDGYHIKNYTFPIATTRYLSFKSIALNPCHVTFTTLQRQQRPLTTKHPRDEGIRRSANTSVEPLLCHSANNRHTSPCAI